jgi:hypothetical protein
MQNFYGSGVSRIAVTQELMQRGGSQDMGEMRQARFIVWRCPTVKANAFQSGKTKEACASITTRSKGSERPSRGT